MDISVHSYMPSYPVSEKKETPGDVDANAALETLKAPHVRTAAEANAEAKAKREQAVAEFSEYASKSTMDKYIEAWLNKHGLTKEDLEKMSPEDQQKIVTQMKEDIEREIKLSMERKQEPISILV